jgi:hypothetical protein
MVNTSQYKKRVIFFCITQIISVALINTKNRLSANTINVFLIVRGDENLDIFVGSWIELQSFMMVAHIYRGKLPKVVVSHNRFGLY